MKVLTIALAALFLLPGPAAAQSGVTRITYQTRACYGRCPVYRVTVGADGTGLFEGRQHVAVQGPRRFRITPAQFRVFARHLEPLRPARGSARYAGRARCGAEITDLPWVEVRWLGPGRRRQALEYYYGCDPQRYRAMADRLHDAPARLPIAAFIGPRPRGR